MSELHIVNTICHYLISKGYKVAIEIANLYRSADIAAFDNNGDLIIVECKVSSIGRAIEQARTHKISADKVFIGTFYRNTKTTTLHRIQKEGLGLLYVKNDGTVEKMHKPDTNENVWNASKQKIKERIVERINAGTHLSL